MIAPKINPKSYSSVDLVRVSGKLAVQYFSSYDRFEAGHLRSLIARHTKEGTGLGVRSINIREPFVIVLFDNDSHAMEYFLSI